jgi:SNF2 family DNA or RNA helicase
MLDLIRWRLHSDPFLEDLGLGVLSLHGGMDVKARDSTLKEFRENPKCRVLLMSLKAGGVALNLSRADHIFLMVSLFSVTLSSLAHPGRIESRFSYLGSMVESCC